MSWRTGVSREQGVRIARRVGVSVRSYADRALPAALTFQQARDVEERHAALYKHALSALLRDETHDYYVCQVCGYVAERETPERCPVCNAGGKEFRLVV